MIGHSQPQPQPQTTFCATLSSCQLQGCQKESFIDIEREEKRMMGKRQTETKRKKELNKCKARVFPTEINFKKKQI
jgi:hypothetical protein